MCIRTRDRNHTIKNSRTFTIRIAEEKPQIVLIHFSHPLDAPLRFVYIYIYSIRGSAIPRFAFRHTHFGAPPHHNDTQTHTWERMPGGRVANGKRLIKFTDGRTSLSRERQKTIAASQTPKIHNEININICRCRRPDPPSRALLTLAGPPPTPNIGRANCGWWMVV